MRVTDAAPNDRDWFSRPGDSLLTAMRRRGVSREVLAERLPGGAEQLTDIVSGRAMIDQEAAVALSDLIGGTQQFWQTRQRRFDEDLDRAVAAMPSEDLAVWLRNIPTPEGSRARSATGAGARSELRRRLAFFGVSTLQSWEARYGRDRTGTRFRNSTSYDTHEGAIAMWLRQGELDASLQETGIWSATALELRVPAIRALSRISKPARFIPQLRALLAEAGVALSVVRAPAGCRASGASRMIAADRAMLLVSFRFRSDDQFWFTVMHEIGHLLLHGASAFVDDERTSYEDDPCELEANAFAASVIVPKARLPELERLPTTGEAIRRFAVSLGVAPGLVLGQMEHRGLIAHGALRGVRRHWTWEQIEAS